MEINTIDNGYEFVLDLLADKTRLPEDKKIKLGDTFALRIKIPNPQINSSITPPFMEAFLELQRQLYQLSALQKKGIANIRFLSEDEKRDLDFSVTVQDGSSLLTVSLDDAFKEWLSNIGDKMSGMQEVGAILSLAVLFAAGWGFKTYLDYRKTVKLEELKSAEHKTALETIQSGHKDGSEKYEALTQIIAQQGEFGKKSLEVIEKAFDAMVKAVSKTGAAVINDISLGQEQAKALCASARMRSEEELLILRVHVIDVNTQDSNMLSVTIRDIENDNEYKLQVKEKAMQEMAAAGKKNPREKIFAALEKRAPIAVELNAKIHDGDIRSVEFVKVIDD